MKLREELVNVLVALYMIISFVLMINQNFEALYLNLIGFLMMAIPLYMSRG